MSELNKVTIEMSKPIKKAIKIDPATGLTEPLNGVYLKSLEGTIWTEEELTKLSEHNTNFAAATVVALGEAGEEFLKKHKKFKHVSIVIPTIGKDNFSATVKKSVPTINPSTKEAGIKYGAATVKLDFYGAGPVGEVKKAKAFVSELFATSFAD